MKSLLGIAVFLVYGVITWRIGFALRKHYLILQHLRTAKAELKPGFSLNARWFELHRASTARLWGFSVLLLLLGIPFALVLYTPENRLTYNLGAVLIPFAAPLLGLMGQIPLPGISIET
jgi:hypothetical protein